MKATLYVLAVMFFLIACNRDTSLTGYDSRLRVKNNSGRTIYYSTSVNYPDTINYELDVCPKEKSRRVEPNSYKAYGAYHNWEWAIDNLPGKRLMVFIHDANQLDSIGDCGVIMYNIEEGKYILKRYDVTTEYLKNNNWTIVYE